MVFKIEKTYAALDQASGIRLIVNLRQLNGRIETQEEVETPG